MQACRSPGIEFFPDRFARRTGFCPKLKDHNSISPDEFIDPHTTILLCKLATFSNLSSLAERLSPHGLRQATECLHFPYVRRNCSKPKIGIFTGVLRLRKLVHVLSLPIIWRAGRRPSSQPASLQLAALSLRPQPCLPFSWSVSWSLILVGHRSSCLLLYF